MQFNSFVFILLFMPVTVTAYFLFNKISVGIGKIILIVASVIFYACFDLKLLLFLGISIGINFLLVWIIEREMKWKKILLFFPILINVGILLYFKYFNFALENINRWFGKEYALKSIILPVGISFITFQQIAYVVAVYNAEIEKADLIDYLAYILYFPKLLMGPLAEPADFIAQLNEERLKKVDWDNFAHGIKLFSYGLFKKIMLADVFSKAVAWGFENIEIATSMDWILVMLFYTFEIYFDFSGYSDMATGTSLMLNINLPINFDSPYKSVSIRDFWKRWHISLTKFLTKYIYIPLGGSKRGKFLTYVNTMIVFLVSGIWHGANWTFILWGILHGLFSVLDRIFENVQKKVFEPAKWIVTFAIVNVLWLLFRSESISQWYGIIRTISFFEDTTIHNELMVAFVLPETTFIRNVIPLLGKLSDKIRGFWMLLFTVCAFGLCLLPENNYRRPRSYSIITMLLAVIAFVWSFIGLSSESVFVYFNF